MDSHIAIPRRILNSTVIDRPQNGGAYGYVFANVGNTIANVIPFGFEIAGSAVPIDSWTLEPGDVIDTRNFGTLDEASYKIEFIATPMPNDAIQCGNETELHCTTFLKV